MKQYRKEIAAMSQDFDYGNPCFLKEHIAWLSQQLAKVPVESQAMAYVEFVQDYDDVSTTLTVVYKRLETDQEEHIREEAMARYLAKQEKQNRHSAEVRRIRVMENVDNMSPEEKQVILDHLQQLSETDGKES